MDEKIFLAGMKNLAEKSLWLLLLFINLAFGFMTTSVIAQESARVRGGRSANVLTHQDTNVVKVLNRNALEELEARRYENAIQYAQNAIDLAEKLAYQAGKAQATYLLGKAHRKTNRYTTSLNNYLAAAALFSSLKDQANLSGTFSGTWLPAPGSTGL
ncbi:MAG: hypothetical protein HC880_19110, partial [Bacteroidia bacterium]|nr:hypothetical protein [Bacteroidia bacterium]